MNKRERWDIADENELIQNKLTDPHERLLEYRRILPYMYCRIMILWKCTRFIWEKKIPNGPRTAKNNSEEKKKEIQR